MLYSILALLFLSTPADSNGDTVRVVAVSNRVGPDVSAEERDRFQLFPGINGFDSARFLLLPDSSYIAEITRRHGDQLSRTQYQIPQQQFRRIGYYVDHFDEIVSQLAQLADGAVMYQSLWTGIPRDSATAYVRNGLSVVNRIVDATSGASLGAGIGGCLGAVTGISFKETRVESVWVSNLACLLGTSMALADSGHWYRYYVDVYTLNHAIYAASAAGGLLVGAATGYLAGNALDRRKSRNESSRHGIADRDLFGNPITEVEVRQRMRIEGRAAGTFFGLAGGAVMGGGVGLLAATIARAIVFRAAKHDSIELKNDGFAFDVPLLTILIGGALQGAYAGFCQGETLDRKAAIARIKKERLYLPSEGSQPWR